LVFDGFAFIAILVGESEMDKVDIRDRIAQILIALAALAALLNGGFMILDPFGWYQALPTVKFTGPPNPHFIRDIGLAYLTCAVMLGWAARYPAGRWLAALAGGLWLSFHGALHVWEVSTGVCAPHIFWQDAPAVLGPPLLVWVALVILFAAQKIVPAGVPKRIFLALGDKMAPDESAYMHEIAGAPGHAFEKFAHFMPASMHRDQAPHDLFQMARIGATLVEDCGPCALTAARWALQHGMAPDLVNAALAGKPPEGDLKTAFDFGHAIATQSADAFILGDAIEAKHGRATRLELAMTAAIVRSYPAMKRGLGLTKSCSMTKLEV
jgi:hypothetical protein